MVEPGVEPGTSWLVVRSSDHQATRLVDFLNVKREKKWFTAHVYFKESPNEEGDENASKLPTNVHESTV